MYMEVLEKKEKLEDAFRMYLAKYQIVGFLEEYFKGEIKKTILNRNKERLIDYLFDNIPNEDIPHRIDYYDKFPRPSNTGKQIENKTGMMKLSDEEYEDLINRQDYSNIYEGKNPLGKASGNNKINLLEHQRKFLNGFFLGNLRSAIVFHGVGTGKTLASAGACKLYLQLYPKGTVIIVTPPAVMFNFIDSLISYGINPQDRRISYYSYDRFSKNKVSTENSLIIIDEAHNLRTEIIGGFSESEKEGMSSQYEYNLKEVAKGKRPASFIVKGFKANKIIMLTATPFVNDPYDIENLMAIGSSRVALGRSYFGEMVSSENFRYDYFKYRISKYDRNFESGDFPEMREKYVGIAAKTKEQADSIKAIAGQKNPFYTYTRQAGLVEEKIKYCIDIIKKHPTKKFVIYSAYVFQGIKKVESLLKEGNIDYGFITGGMNVKTIGRYIDAYNNYNNPDYEIDKIRVLLISKAGAEGVNLLETRGIFVIDGVWNEALYEQVVARAVRYRSHKKLPSNEQFVDVYKIFYCMEFELPFIKRLNEGKGFDYQKFFNAFQLLKKKKKSDEKILELSESSNSSIISESTNKQLEEILVKSGNYDANELKSLKKGSSERKAYIETNLTFGKNKAKYETQAILSGISIPSTDFYMFVLQKIKENKINMFVKEVIKVPTVEKTVEDIPKSKQLLEELKSGKLTEKEIIENLIIGLVGKEQEINKILKQTKKGVSDINKLISKSNDLKALSTSKARARVKQEFFTPNKIVKEILEIGGFNNLPKYSSLKVLEGSAGWGNIVRGILLMSMKKTLSYNVKIDMVEIQEDNRIELQKLMDEVPTAVNLMKEKNFLLFTPSKRYDFIFMNPPFFLQKKNNPEYKRDVYDYDFLLRAYSMLDLNGVLVFITGMKWKENKTIQAFYKEVDADIKELKGVSWTGEEVKKGGEVSKLDITIIYIKKLFINSKLDNSLLKESLKLFVDVPKQLGTIITGEILEKFKPKTKAQIKYREKQEKDEEFLKGWKNLSNKEILNKNNIKRVEGILGSDETMNRRDKYLDKVDELRS